MCFQNAKLQKKQGFRVIIGKKYKNNIAVDM